MSVVAAPSAEVQTVTETVQSVAPAPKPVNAPPAAIQPALLKAKVGTEAAMKQNGLLDDKGCYCGPVIIYKLTAPNNKSYIGQVQEYARAGKRGWERRGLDTRWREHCCHATKRCKTGCWYLHSSIAKWGKENFTREILTVVPKSEANQCEQRMVEGLGTIAPHGLNWRAGGDCVGVSAETRMKMSRSAKARDFSSLARSERAKNITMETRLKMSISAKNKIVSAEAIANRCAGLRKKAAAKTGLPTMISHVRENISKRSAAGYRVAVRYNGKVHARVCTSGKTMASKLQRAIAIRNSMLETFGLPAIDSVK